MVYNCSRFPSKKFNWRSFPRAAGGEGVMMKIWRTKIFQRTALQIMLGLSVLFIGACQTETTSSSNAANANANANAALASNANNANAASSPSGSSATIDAREPDRYTAKLTISGQATGGTSINFPPLTIDVARDGANRRYAITVPITNEQFIYLDRADKRYLIEPARKQYAELTADNIGFNIPRSLTPGEIVSSLRNKPGVERVGDDKMNGRDVIKYRYAASAQTGTNAGQVSSETFVYVDKETGLPVRAELTSSATGNVQGERNVHLIADMSDINTNFDPTLFDVPQNFRKMTPEEIKQQAQIVAKAFQYVIGQLNLQQTSPTATPSATPSGKG
jgi:hypothetical protein